MRRAFFALVTVALLALGGCANTFTYDGVRYNSKDEAMGAARTKTSAALANMSPLPAPLVDKTVVVVLPTRSAMQSFLLQRARTVQPNFVLNPQTQEQLDYLVDVARIGYHANVEALRKKNIYKAVEMLEQDGSTTFAAAPTRDIINVQLPEGSSGAAVWFLTNVQNGRQIIASDTTKANMTDRAESMMDSIKALALQR